MPRQQFSLSRAGTGHTDGETAIHAANDNMGQSDSSGAPTQAKRLPRREKAVPTFVFRHDLAPFDLAKRLRFSTPSSVHNLSIHTDTKWTTRKQRKPQGDR